MFGRVYTLFVKQNGKLPYKAGVFLNYFYEWQNIKLHDFMHTGGNAMKKNVKEYIFITVGAVLVAISVHFFLSPANLAAGGVSGIAIILSKFFPTIPIGFMMLIMNAILFVIGFIFIGNSFGGKTIYASLSL